MANRGFFNHIWYKLLDEEGVPVSGANVFIYEALNPTTEIVLYGSPSPSANITQPLVTTSGGVFEFYVQDDIGVSVGASGHYPWDTEYLISWSDGVVDKSGIITGDALFGRFAQVNESPSAASSTRVNKAMSNYLGWVIQDHIDFQFGTTPRCGSSSSSSSSVSSTSSSSSSESSSSSSSLSSSSISSSNSALIVSAGYLFNDTTPESSSLTFPLSTLIDSNVTAAAAPSEEFWDTTDSYGIELQNSQIIKGLHIDCIHLSDYTVNNWGNYLASKTTYRGTDITLNIYVSEDNSNWTKVDYKDFVAPYVYRWDVNQFGFRILFPSPVTSAGVIEGKYIKVINASNDVLDIGTPSLKISEVSLIKSDIVQTYGFDSVYTDRLKVINSRIVKHRGAADAGEAICGVGRNSGKYYFEVRYVNSYTNASVGLKYSPTAEGQYVGNNGGYRYQSQGRMYKDSSLIHNNVTAWGVPYQQYIIQVAVDLDNNTLWFGLDNIWVAGNPTVGDPLDYDNPDPSSNEEPMFNDLTGAMMYPAVSMGFNGNGYMELCTTEDNFTYEMPLNFVAWESTQDKFCFSPEDNGAGYPTGYAHGLNNNYKTAVRFLYPDGSTNTTTRSRSGKISGKWYYELKLYKTGSWKSIGWIDQNSVLSGFPGNQSGNVGVGWLINGLNRIYHDGTFEDWGDPVSANDDDYLMTAIDCSTGDIWLGKNGVWYNDGVPSAGADPNTLDPAYTETEFIGVSAFPYAYTLDNNFYHADTVTIRTRESECEGTIPLGFSALE